MKVGCLVKGVGVGRYPVYVDIVGGKLTKLQRPSTLPERVTRCLYPPSSIVPRVPGAS